MTRPPDWSRWAPASRLEPLAPLTLARNAMRAAAWRALACVPMQRALRGEPGILRADVQRAARRAGRGHAEAAGAAACIALWRRGAGRSARSRHAAPTSARTLAPGAERTRPVAPPESRRRLGGSTATAWYFIENRAPGDGVVHCTAGSLLRTRGRAARSLSSAGPGPRAAAGRRHPSLPAQPGARRLPGHRGRACAASCWRRAGGSALADPLSVRAARRTAMLGRDSVRLGRFAQAGGPTSSRLRDLALRSVPDGCTRGGHGNSSA